MLAPLGFYLLFMLIACTLMLLTCWVYDNVRAQIEAGRPRLANIEFSIDPHARRWHADVPAQRLLQRGRGRRRRHGRRRNHAG